MTRAERTALIWSATGASLLWIVLSGWLMVATLPENAVENHGSSTIKDRMSDCTGNFRDRYECKEQIIIKGGRETFAIVLGRFLLVLVPPILASVWLSSYLRRHPAPLVEIRRVEDGDWKARAQMHTENQNPDEPLPPSHAGQGHHLMDSIAPMEDWKARANNRGPKRDD